MKKLLLIFCLFALSCTFKKDGWFVKAQDGKIYRLEPGAGDETYRLMEVDTAIVNVKFK